MRETVRPVAAAGEAVRFWAAGHLLKTQELVTSGPYRYTRNPLYLGRLLIFTGLCVMAQMPWQANWIVLVLGYAVFFDHIHTPALLRARTNRLFDWIIDGKLKVRLGGVYPLAEAARAHADMESRATTGKLLLIP